MTQDALTEAAVRLADILLAENTALKATDFAEAARLLPAKQAATAALTAAQAGALHAPAGMKALAARLTELADENKRLLEQAIVVQRRVIGTVARAMQTAQPQANYGRGGARSGGGVPAMALRANA